MNITAINQTAPNNKVSPNFKQAIPVVYWVTEAGGKSFVPAVTEELSKTLNNQVSFMNCESSGGNSCYQLFLKKKKINK